MFKHIQGERFASFFDQGLTEETKAGVIGGGLKRSLDIAISALLLAAVLPLFAIIAVIIKITDGNAVFYSQKRVGYGGKYFDCLKFRTMVVEGDKVLDDYLAANPEEAENWHLYRKLKHDPRILGFVGRFLRKKSLDELPQLINVLRGDMSLVGPRPVTEVEYNLYYKDTSVYNKARPGITGLWQISGRNEVTFEERVDLDRRYVKEWSLQKDLAIILKTPKVVVAGNGAY